MARARQIAVAFRIGIVAGLGLGAVALHQWWQEQEEEEDNPDSGKGRTPASAEFPAAAELELSAKPGISQSNDVDEADDAPTEPAEEPSPSGLRWRGGKSPPIRQRAPVEVGAIGQVLAEDASSPLKSPADYCQEPLPESRVGAEPSAEELLHRAWAGAEEVHSLAEGALDEAAVYFDDYSSRWSSSEAEDGVLLSSLARPNSRLPIFRGLLEVTSEKAPSMTVIAQVMLSYSCRRLYDPLLEKSALLARSGEGTGLVCNFFHPSPVESGRSLRVGAFGVRRQTTATEAAPRLIKPGAGIRERVTLAFAAVPERLVDPFAAQLAEITGDIPANRSDSKLFALDAVVREDGSLRVGFLIHSDCSTLKIPAFLLRKIFASMPAQPVTQIVMMATAGMTPQRVVAMAGPDPEETEERLVGGRQIRVSTLFHDIFP